MAAVRPPTPHAGPATGPATGPLAGRHVLFLSWRDTGNPEGGGAELYLEKMAAGLARRGCRVTVFSAAYAGAPPAEVVDGIRYVRRGSKLTVYLQGMLGLLLRRFGTVDVVVDIQNGIPFFSRLITRRPVVVLVHHIHREQWPVVYPGLTGRIGWWIEHRLAPRLYRRCQYVAVSAATREELCELGVDEERIAVVRNGTEPYVETPLPKSAAPSVCVVGRLVPHKQVEHAIDAVLALRQEIPGLVLRVVGGGWWDAALREYADEHRAGDAVVFEGHVDERRKHEIYQESWLLLLPSLKEGWGLVVGEAGMHGSPTVAYRSAGGTRESVADGRSGVLVDTQDEFTAAVRALLLDPARRSELADGAQEMSRQFGWKGAQDSFALVLEAVLEDRRVSDGQAH